jgi:hypothetical protein
MPYDAYGRFISDDGRWWWNGQTWIPIQHAVPRRSSGCIPALVAGVVVAVLLLLLVGAVVVQQFTSSCTVGYAGTDLNITVQGWASGSACDEMIRSSAGVGYRADPTGTLVCRYPIDGRTWTVRDQGVFKLYGASACEYLSKQLTPPKPSGGPP